MSDDWKTSYTLLKRAADQTDGQAWKEFHNYYDRFIYYLLHRMNLKPQEIDELHQTIMLRLWKNVKNYQRTDKNFRSWLAVVVRNVAYDYFRSEDRRRKVFIDEVEVDLVKVSNFTTSIEDTIESEWESYMVNFAMDRLRTLFSKNAIRVFEMSLEGHSAQEISETLNIGVDSVYTLKNRVKARLVKEVRAVMMEVEGK